MTTVAPTTSHHPSVTPITPSTDPTRMDVFAWESLMSSVDGCDKSRLNSFVMNWLMVAGYQHVAEQFQQETGTTSSVPLSSISARTNVRESLSSGAIDTALAQIEALAPTLLASNPGLYLHLKQQKLIELIRANEIEQALTYARTHLRDGCKDEAEFLSQMESIMSLLAFSALPPDQNPMRHLLGQEQRQSLGDQVNEKILETQFAYKESQLGLIIKQLQHSQEALKQFMPQFPRLDTQPTSSNAVANSSTSSTASASQTSSSSPLPPLLDPSRVFEQLCQVESEARRLAAEQTAKELEAVLAQVEKDRAAKAERQAARRARAAAVAAAEREQPRSAFRQDVPMAGEEEEEDDDDEEEEEQHAQEEEEEEAQMST